jgi:hypothetical protein
MLCATALLFALSGCKTSRRLTVAGEPSSVVKEAGEFFASIGERSFHYRTLSARTRAELSFGGKELSSRVDIKMVKDSVIQLSILPMLGIEAFRIEFGTDSVKITDRMNRRYAAESYARLKSGMPVDFNLYNLQALFTNNIFAPGEREVTPRQYGRFTLRRDGAVTEAQIKGGSRILYAFRADGEEKLLSTKVADASERYALQWIYDDFRIAEGQIFPMQMEARAVADGATAVELRLYFSRVQRDVPVDVNPAIPERYKRIDLADIVKGINQM